MTLYYVQPEIIEFLTVIHYGNNEYAPEILGEIKNYHDKPCGGLWVSPLDSKYGWKDWCAESDFSECNKENSFKLKFKKRTNIITIDSFKDLTELPLINSYGILNPDYELLAKRADAIWLTEKGNEEVHFSTPGLNGWDCESILIMNPLCCYQIINEC